MTWFNVMNGNAWNFSQDNMFLLRDFLMFDFLSVCSKFRTRVWPQKVSTSFTNSQHAFLNPWFTGLWIALTFTGGGLLDVRWLELSFFAIFQVVLKSVWQVQVYANFCVHRLKNKGFGALFWFLQNQLSKNLRFWIEHIEIAVISWKCTKLLEKDLKSKLEYVATH